MFHTLVKQACRSLATKASKKATVAVEGNIGSGKTSLLQYFRQTSDVQVLQEPVDRWTNIHGDNGLKLIYEDPQRWGMPVQSFIQLTMLQAHLQPHTCSLKMMERSIYSAKYCFAESLYKSGKMDEIEYLILTKWFDWAIQKKDVQLDLIVYLQTKPDVVLERVKNRQRQEEQAVTLNHLQALHELHEVWLIQGSSFPSPAPVLVLDANEDQEGMQQQYEMHRKAILCEVT